MDKDFKFPGLARFLEERRGKADPALFTHINRVWYVARAIDALDQMARAAPADRKKMFEEALKNRDALEATLGVLDEVIAEFESKALPKTGKEMSDTKQPDLQKPAPGAEKPKPAQPNPGPPYGPGVTPPGTPPAPPKAPPMPATPPHPGPPYGPGVTPPGTPAEPPKGVKGTLKGGLGA